MDNLNNLIDTIFPPVYSVVFLHAHPDDESFLSAGLLNELAIRGRKCIIMFGAAAIVYNQEQTFVRQKEATDACNILGITSIIFLDFCEPKYSGKETLPLIEQKIEKISKNILTALHKNNVQTPFILISYDKNGGYGNVDHQIIHTVGRYFQKKNKKLAPFLFEITINRDKVIKWLKNAQNRLSLKLIPKLSYWSPEFGLSEKEIQLQYQLTDRQIELKCKALCIHKSQIIPELFPVALEYNDFVDLFGNEFLHIPSHISL